MALPSDREQPIYIQADHAERNENLGTTIYTGSVQMDQGSLRILAKQVTVHNAADGVEKIIATGVPAHLQQKPSADKPLVIARGNTITYTMTNERIVLLDNALLEQDGSTTHAARIDYDVGKASATAVGNENKRVEMVLQPQQQRPQKTKQTVKPNIQQTPDIQSPESSLDAKPEQATKIAPKDTSQ